MFPKSLTRRAAAVVLALALLPLAGCGSQTPTDVYDEYVDHVMNREWGRSYDLLSSDSQAQMGKAFSLMAGFRSAFSRGEEPDDAGDKSGRELYVEFMESAGEEEGMVPDTGEVISEEIDGDRAVLTVRIDGREQPVHLVREEGKWKLSFMPG